MSNRHLEGPFEKILLDDEVDIDGSWAVSYGDMVTLLLMFFILFFSVDKERDRFVSLQAELMKEMTPKLTTPGGMPDNMQVGAAKGEGLDEQIVTQWGGKATKLGSKVIVEFPDTCFFDFGDVNLTSAGAKQLGLFVNHYLPFAGNYFVTVRAFTDTVPVLRNGNKQFQDNLDLSALRSVAALRRLQLLGIPLRRMRAEGFGELKLSAEDKEAALVASRKQGDRGIKLARKVVLIIEPETRDRL